MMEKSENTCHFRMKIHEMAECVVGSAWKIGCVNKTVKWSDKKFPVESIQYISYHDQTFKNQNRHLFLEVHEERTPRDSLLG